MPDGPAANDHIDCVRHPGDENEIPKKFDVTCLHDVDKMRKKHHMKNAMIPAKQLYNKEYWARKKDINISKRASNESIQGKRRLEQSFEGPTINSQAKKEKKNNNNSNSISSSPTNNMSIDNLSSPNDNDNFQ